MTASLTIQYKNNGYNEVLPAKFLHNVATNGSKPNGIYQNGAFFDINLSLLFVKFCQGTLYTMWRLMVANETSYTKTEYCLI